MEYVFQMGPMLLVGALAIGFLAEAGWRPGGYGLLRDLMTGLAGGLVVGGLTWLNASTPPGMLAMVAFGAIGASLAIVGQRVLWRAPALARAASIG